MILSYTWGCDPDKPHSFKEKRGINFERAKLEVQEKKHKRPGEALLDHPGFSTSSLREPIRPVTDRVTVNNYFCEIKNSADGKKVCMTFFKSGKEIRSDCTDSDAILSIIMSPPGGKDINGDGVPDLIVEHYSGGAHCCYEYAIFSLGNTLELTSVLEGKHSPLEFKDLDGDGKYEVIGRDWTFAYWNTSFAESPAPQIILRWNDGRYRLTGDLMKKPANQNELLQLAEEFRRDALFVDESMKSLHWEPKWWAVMLELIYTGNGNLAWKFCDWFWPVSDQQSISKKYMAEKKKFLSEFKKQLKTSPYWLDLKKLNGWR